MSKLQAISAAVSIAMANDGHNREETPNCETDFGQARARLLRGKCSWRVIELTYPAMRGAVRNILAVGSTKRGLGERRGGQWHDVVRFGRAAIERIM